MLLQCFLHCNVFSVPNEDPKSPVFKTFPRSTTVQEGERIEFDCEFKSAPSKGITFLFAIVGTKSLSKSKGKHQGAATQPFAWCWYQKIKSELETSEWSSV